MTLIAKLLNAVVTIYSSTLVRAPPSYTSDILWFIKTSESEFLLGIFTCISTAEKNS